MRSALTSIIRGMLCKGDINTDSICKRYYEKKQNFIGENYWFHAQHLIAQQGQLFLFDWSSEGAYRHGHEVDTDLAYSTSSLYVQAQMSNRRIRKADKGITFNLHCWRSKNVPYQPPYTNRNNSNLLQTLLYHYRLNTSSVFPLSLSPQNWP